MTHNDITHERKHWGILCYAIVGGYFEQRKYQGYTVKEARQLFYREMNSIEQGGDW